MLHTGGIGVAPALDSLGHPIYVDEIACNFPKMVVIMGHCGRGFYDEAASILRKHVNVYADVSANFAKLRDREYIFLQELIKRVKLWTGNVDKLLFGSDYPYYGQKQTMNLLEMCLAPNDLIPITKEDISQIKNVNTEEFCKRCEIY
jgi:predicted TIM-barrel fold metal-dependent hydrolase